jgi:hypothetical protein
MIEIYTSSMRTAAEGARRGVDVFREQQVAERKRNAGAGLYARCPWAGAIPVPRWPYEIATLISSPAVCPMKYTNAESHGCHVATCGRWRSGRGPSSRMTVSIANLDRAVGHPSWLEYGAPLSSQNCSASADTPTRNNQRAPRSLDFVSISAG